VLQSHDGFVCHVWDGAWYWILYIQFTIYPTNITDRYPINNSTSSVVHREQALSHSLRNSTQYHFLCNIIFYFYRTILDQCIASYVHLNSPLHPISETQLMQIKVSYEDVRLCAQNFWREIGCLDVIHWSNDLTELLLERTLYHWRKWWMDPSRLHGSCNTSSFWIFLTKWPSWTQFILCQKRSDQARQYISKLKVLEQFMYDTE
jgi:hypothetical protein